MTTELPVFRIVVIPRDAILDHHNMTIARQLGIDQIAAIYASRLYYLRGNITHAQAQLIANDLLADPVTETALTRHEKVRAKRAYRGHEIDVMLLPGVTDPAAENLVKAAHLIDIPLDDAATGQHFHVLGANPDGKLDRDTIGRIANEVLSNPVVQQTSIDQWIAPPFFDEQRPDDTVETIVLTSANDDELLTISQERRLSLDQNEMIAIRAYYRQESREPTDVELEMLAQTWSEHCVHKTFKADIAYTGPDGTTETINGLLNTYIRAATDKINRPWVRSAFVDDAGIVRFNDAYDLAFKVETHNHPSALEPFGGANTGIGGVIRDVLGVSARPIANTDILCFGRPDLPLDQLPHGVLHPTRIADGVVHGIEDYGNKMGIPTVNGAIVYHDGYTSNPLVYCGCLGVLPHGAHPSKVQPGDLIVAIGGRVGRDGLRGATFSSMEMDQTTSDIAGTAVQIGHPIMEKQVLEVVMRCRDEQLYNALTDCGAGGFSSSVGELGEDVGATVELSQVSLKYPGLRPWEIWLSEAQERMVLSVPPEKLARVQEIAASQDVEATVLGTFDPTGHMTITYKGETVGDLSMAFLHDGIPTRQMTAKWEPPTISAEPARQLLPTQDALLQLLALPTIRSKEDVVRRYDHEVQGGTAVKPFVGVADNGPSDAAVIVPQETIADVGYGISENDNSEIRNPKSEIKGVAISNGICPTYGALDPYAMAWAAVDEALRNLVAVGTNPDEVSILDNFCWGNPQLPDRLGALVRCAQGCHDAAVAYRTPFISGKDSLNNEYVGADGEKHAIPGTILISAIGLVPDVAKTVTMDLKQPGNLLYIVGETRAELGGSQYAVLHEEQGGKPPQPLTAGLARYRAVHRAIKEGLVTACHDLSEGGLGVALAEMALAGRLGASIELDKVPANVAHDDVLLFSESIGRFLVEVAPENQQQFEYYLAADNTVQIGNVNSSGRVTITGVDSEAVVDIAVAELEQAWRGHVTADFGYGISETIAPQSEIEHPKSNVARRPKVAILHANGTNRDRDAALACELAGGAPEIVHINQLIAGERNLLDYHMLVVPGGFSYGDDLGAGVLFSAELKHRFGDMVRTFVADGRPTLGICNGFQTLVKAGLFELPTVAGHRPITLTYNERGQFECRWVLLEPNLDSPSIFTKGLTEPIYCPVAHGEGRFMVQDEATASLLQQHNLVALTYRGTGKKESGERYGYPANPNGSILDIAGITNPAGNVLGLMPHPENHIFPWQNPQRHRGAAGLDGLRIFTNAIRNT
ncbi:MAG: phosphoribosylformylglycinamidine synthase subunit PurL [Anaerolineae bacterium]|nr:phosphoribosylformylglycinamidine synthase subunit PurL [Anaerolineae bacterium]